MPNLLMVHFDVLKRQMPEEMAREKLGPDCARWLATGEGLSGLAQHALYDVARDIREPEVTAAVTVSEPLVVETQLMQDRRV